MRKQHMDAFQKQADTRLSKKIAEFLKAEDAEEVEGLDDETLEQMVTNGIARARTHGLTHESSIQGYVQLMFDIAPNFDQHPAFARALRDGKQEPDENARIELIFERVTEQEWEQAQANYDEKAWGVPMSEG